ncbi:caspase-3-like [Oculina patagonica]
MDNQDGNPDVFTVKAYDLECVNGEYILKLPERGEQDATFKTFSELTAKGDNYLHPDGAVFLKNVNNTLMAVGALAFVDDKISPVAFSQLQEFAGPQRRPVPEQTPAAATRTHAPCQESSGDDINYTAASGYVLVINNNIFPQRDVVERTGSNDDVKNLIRLFDDFNFRHMVYDNQTQSEMLKVLRDTAEKDFSRYDCFVCVILSHGSKDGIYGTDDEVIKVEAITSLFRRDECPSLEGKPKIFLIQACRGTRQDRVPIESDSEPIPLSSSSLPADADFLICYASAPGHQSYRQPLIGSWFISSVVDVFKEYAEREHLMEMMLRVNNRVAQFFSREGLKQMPCQVCMLRRKIYFDPKYSSRT